MDTDEPSSHFAWDLLDVAKQATLKQTSQVHAPSRMANIQDAKIHEPVLTQDVARAVDTSKTIQPGFETEGAVPSARHIEEPLLHEVPLEVASVRETGRLPPIEAPPIENIMRLGGEIEMTEHTASALRQTRPPETSPFVDGSIPKLGWSDVGMATEPGRYRSRYGLIQIEADEIWVWKMHPNATFAVLHPSPYSDEDFSKLGSFHLGT